MFNQWSPQSSMAHLTNPLTTTSSGELKPSQKIAWEGSKNPRHAPENHDQGGSAARERVGPLPERTYPVRAARKTLIFVELRDGLGCCQCVVFGKELCDESLVKLLTRECTNDVVG